FTEEGNWEEENTNIPYRPDTLSAVAAELELTPEEALEKLALARRKLHQHRFDNRIHPGADDKLLLQWNALLISGWTWCYRATKNSRYLGLAEDLWDVLNDQLLAKGQWYRNLTNGRLGAKAFLDDYAALAEAALDLHEVTFDLRYVFGAPAGAVKGEPQGPTSALALAEHLLQNFSAPSGPMFLLRPAEGNELPVTTVDLFDNALPSGNSQLMHSLLRLGRLTGREDLIARAEEMLAAMAGSLERYPSSFGGWVHAALLHAAPDRELAITGPKARMEAATFLSRYRPELLIVATETPIKDVPLLENRYLPNQLRFFVCENRACQLPVTTAAAAEAQLDGPITLT
ncbi:MAG: hypothetical protein AAGA31_02310, partial [Bacteroidota bacterium]